MHLTIQFLKALVYVFFKLMKYVVRHGSVWCGMAQYGAAWLSMVRHSSVWCGMAQYGAAWLSMVRHGSVGNASACCKAGPSSILGSAPQEGYPHRAYKRWGNGERLQRMATDEFIVIEWMHVIKYENKQKEWHPAIKPLWNMWKILFFIDRIYPFRVANRGSSGFLESSHETVFRLCIKLNMHI